MTRKLEKNSQIFAVEELGLLLKSVSEMSRLESIPVKILLQIFDIIIFGHDHGIFQRYFKISE